METLKKTLRTIENQYGDEIPAAVLFQENGQLYLWEINCYSSLHLNLGNCHCVNHLPSDDCPVSTQYVIEQFGKEALDGFEAPGREQLVFDAFGVDVGELEKYLEISYFLGTNPLPVLRKKTKAPVVFAEEPERLTFPEEEPGTTIFVVNGRGEISVVTNDEPQPTYEVDDNGMPELAIPFDVPELRDLD